jgi:hypothetical protein
MISESQANMLGFRLSRLEIARARARVGFLLIVKGIVDIIRVWAALGRSGWILLNDSP